MMPSACTFSSSCSMRGTDGWRPPRRTCPCTSIWKRGKPCRSPPTSRHGSRKCRPRIPSCRGRRPQAGASPCRARRDVRAAQPTSTGISVRLRPRPLPFEPAGCHLCGADSAGRGMTEPNKLRAFDAPPAPVPGGIAARAHPGAGAPYLAGLNPEQRLAVETLDGPVLVLAGAGTGKTRVLTTRIAHILTLGRARPFEILAVTFTNKAAREMKERVSRMVGQMVEGMPWLGTFHSIGVKMLRRHAELVRLKSDFTILDVDDQLRLLKQVLEAENIDQQRWPARALAGMLDNWKNRGLAPEQVPPGEAASFASGRGLKLYTAYQERLKTLNAVDFGDLLLEPIRLLREHPDVLRQYHQRFRFMLVDEYQDTNVAQYLWLRLLGQGSKNLCCVGDGDQSIYGWRGAEVDNILRFEKDFPGAKVIRLERNYRST